MSKNLQIMYEMLRTPYVDFVDKVVLEGNIYLETDGFNPNSTEMSSYFRLYSEGIEESIADLNIYTPSSKELIFVSTTPNCVQYKETKYTKLTHALTGIYNKEKPTNFVFLKCILKTFLFLLIYYPFKILQELLSIIFVIPKAKQLQQRLCRICIKCDKPIPDITYSPRLPKEQKLILKFILMIIISPFILDLYIILSITDFLQTLILFPFTYIVTKMMYHLLHGNPNNLSPLDINLN